MSLPFINFVDDDPLMLELYSSMASAIDAPHKCYSNASEYLANIATKKGSSLLILDISMPDIDGFEVIKQLKTLETMPSLVLASGYDEQLVDSAIRLAKSYGFTSVDSVIKPFNSNFLAQKVKELTLSQ